MSAAARMRLVLAATALLSATTMLGAVDARLGVLHAAGFAAFLGLTVWSVLVRRSDPVGEASPERAGLIAVAAAVVLAIADRHLVVASRGVAPDDVAAAVTVTVCLALAARAPRLAGSPVITGLVLATYALICLSFIGGTRYHSDAVANVHRAAELVLAGADPYRTIDTYESLDRFGLDRGLVTNLEDGTPLRSFNYPALAFIVPVPAVALGLADLRVLYTAMLLVATLAATSCCAPIWRPYVLATVVGNVVIARQYVLAGIDPTWAILLGASLLALRRAERGTASRWLLLSAVLLGLAAASRQPPWFAAPFVIAAVRREHAASAAIRYAGIAIAAFLVPALPFLLTAPAAYAGGMLAPILLPLEPHGIGLVRLGADGLLPLLPRGAYTALALAALLVALLAARRRRPALIGLPSLALAPLFLGWRALQNYFAFGGIFAALAIAEEDAIARAERPLRSRRTREVPDADRQGAARDLGVPGGEGATARGG